jgi:hypothetical protein
MQRTTLIALVSRLAAMLTIIGLLGAQTPNYHLTGRVTTGPSKPAARVWVILDNGKNQMARALTGDDGRYYISGLLQQTYTVIVRRDLKGAELFKRQVSIPAKGDYNIQIK